MATYYWVGGAGLWDLYGTTNWASTSGGAGGAGAPTASDDVIFDSASNATAYTVTVMENAVCRDLTVAGPASGNVTLSGNRGIFIYGSVSMAATGITLSITGSATTRFVAFAATSTGKTINMNGLSWGTDVYFDGVGGGWTFSGAFTCTGIVTLTNGSLSTGGFSFTAQAVRSNNSNTRSLNISSSGVTLTAAVPGAQPVWDLSTTTGLTFTSTLSNIICSTGSSGLTHQFNGGGLTYHNVSFTYPTAAYQVLVSGANTIDKFAIRAPTSFAAGTTNQVIFAANQTIVTLDVLAATYYQRVMLCSDIVGTPRTLTVTNILSIANADFRDITAAGASSPWSDTSCGDCGGNTNITFAAPKTVYCVAPAAVTWTGAGTAPWAATSGGAVANANFPLAQDTAILDNNSLGAITIPGIFNVGTVDGSATTSAAGNFTCSFPAALYLRYNYVGDGNRGGNIRLYFTGNAPQTLTSGGSSVGDIGIQSASTVSFSDAVTTSGSIFLNQGTLNTNNFNLTLGSNGFIVDATNTSTGTGFLGANVNASRTLNLGSSTVTFTGQGQLGFGATNTTFNAGTSSISFSSTVNFATVGSNSFPTIPQLALSFYNVTFANGATINTNTSYNNLTFSSTALGQQTITLAGSVTVSGLLTMSGSSAIARQQIQPQTSVTFTAPYSLSVASVSALSDVDFQSVAVTGAAAPLSGTRLGNCGDNSGITFPPAKTVYWNLAGVQNIDATAWASTSGGLPDINNFPLAQDTAVFDDAGAAGTVAINSQYNLGTIDMSARTSAMTFQIVQFEVFGNWVTGSGITYSGTASVFFSKAGTQTFTSAGKTIPFGVGARGYLTTLTFADDFTGSSIGASFGATISGNTANFSGVSLSVGPGSTLNMGSGTWNLSSVTIDAASTVNKQTANIVLTFTGTTNRVFSGGGKSYNKLTLTGSGTGSITLIGDNTFTEIENTRTSAYTMNNNDTQTVGAFNVSGSAGNLVTLTASVSQIGTLISTGGQVSVDYLNISKSYVSPSATWYSGANSTNSGANYQWNFTVPPAPPLSSGNFFMLMYP
jgi:fibronectin-binding autotransporter adhesin